MNQVIKKDANFNDIMTRPMAPYASRDAGDLPILNAAVKPATGMNAFVFCAMYYSGLPRLVPPGGDKS